MSDKATSERRAWAIANAAAIAGLVFFAVYRLTAFRFSALFTDPTRQVDFAIWYLVPGYIADHLRYPASVTGDWLHVVFQYLPSAAALMLPLHLLPRSAAFGAWLIIEAGAFAVVIHASMRLSGAAAHSGRYVIALAAVLLAESALTWDFRTHNNNIVYLALVLLGLQTRRLWLGALLLALSFNLKLYSALLAVALGWRREYRLAVGMAVAAALIALFLPLFVFGPYALPQLMADWMAQIRYSLSPEQTKFTVTLLRAVSAFLSIDPASSQAFVVTREIQFAWLVLVAAYFIFTGRADGLAANSQARLADMCVALMAPLPLSTWLIPYHAIVNLPAFMLLLVVAVTEAWPRRVRLISVVAMVLTQIVRFAVRDWDYRGAVYLATFVALVIALGAVRRAMNGASAALPARA